MIFRSFRSQENATSKLTEKLVRDFRLVLETSNSLVQVSLKSLSLMNEDFFETSHSNVGRFLIKTHEMLCSVVVPEVLSAGTCCFIVWNLFINHESTKKAA